MKRFLGFRLDRLGFWRRRRSTLAGGLVQRQAADSHPFYPNHVLKNLIVILVSAAAVCAAAALFPVSIEEAADPLGPPAASTRTLWLIRPLCALQSADFPSLALTAAAIVLLFVFMLPFFDRQGASGARHRAIRWMFILIVVLVLAGFAAGGSRILPP